MTGRFGVYGKMPGHGDFVHSGLSRDFVRSWDAWLQHGMTAARASLGTVWTEAFFSAPCWRFFLPPGAAGPDGIQGVLMPSVDRVGRHFPLTVAVSLPPSDTILALHLHSQPLLASLETLALSALDEEVTLPEVEAGLARLHLPDLEAAKTWFEGGAQFVSRPGELDVIADLTGELLRPIASERSLWSTRTDQASQAFSAHGLPDPAMFTHLVSPFSSERKGMVISK